MTKTDTLVGPDFKPRNAIEETIRSGVSRPVMVTTDCRRLQRIPNGYGGTLMEPNPLRGSGKVLKRIFPPLQAICASDIVERTSGELLFFKSPTIGLMWFRSD